MNDSQNQIALYETKDSSVVLEVRADGDTVWLSRKQMSLPFGRDVKTIGKHIGNALREELRGLVVVANFATVQNEGSRQVKRNVEH